MSSYQFTPQAVEDLFEIWSYIASDDLDATDRVEEAIHVACAFLADAPLAGRIREDLTALPLRFWIVQPYRNYWIVYHPEKKPLQVIRNHPRGAKYSEHFEVGVREPGHWSARASCQTFALRWKMGRVAGRIDARWS